MVEVYHEERYLWYRCLMRRDLCGRGVSLGKISVVEEYATINDMKTFLSNRILLKKVISF